MDFLFSLLIILCALSGLWLTIYIRSKKGHHEKMVCPMHSDCDAVIYSEYSHFFGIPVEVLGMLYYALIALTYLLLLLIPSLSFMSLTFAVLVVSTTAFLFSLYLTFIQGFLLRQWCTWCLTSAGLCTIIFGAALGVSEFTFISLLAEHKTIILIAHTIGFAIGLGGATISDIFFFRFLKDLRISHEESATLSHLSEIIWFALALIVLSGLGLYLPAMEELHQSSKFLVKMVVVLVIIVNGAFLNLLVAPNLVKISFGKRHDHEVGELHHIRRLAFILGAVSITSWYSAFILGMLTSVPLSFFPLLLIYLLLLLSAILISHIVERKISSTHV